MKPDLALLDAETLARERLFLKAQLFNTTPAQLLLASRPLHWSWRQRWIFYWKARQLQAGRPLAYVLGKSQFLDQLFLVTPNTLIPRFETEELTAKLIQWLRVRLRSWTLARPFSLLEIGTGAGVIIVSLAKAFPSLTFTAVELCPKALRIAKKNANRLLGRQAAGRIRFLRGDIFALEQLHSQRFDFVVSNPPYVEESAPSTADLAPRVKRYEPPLALFAGADGLAFFKKLAPRLAAWLTPPHGAFCFEIGAGQEKKLLQLFSSYLKKKSLAVFPDLQGKPRFLCGNCRFPKDLLASA